MFALFLFSLLAVLAIAAIATVIDGGLRWWSLFEKLRRDAAMTAQMLELAQVSASATLTVSRVQPARPLPKQVRLNAVRNVRGVANRNPATHRDLSRAAA